MATLQDIDKNAERYAGLRGKLAAEVTALNEEMEAARKRRLTAIKRLVERAAEAHNELLEAVKDSPALFQKPKSLTMHGVRLGYRKGSGGIDFEDADQVVALIKRHHTEDEQALLIITKEKPNKEALEQLGVAELKKLGCTVENTGDVPFIKDAAGDVDKIVKALLKEATAEEAGA